MLRMHPSLQPELVVSTDEERPNLCAPYFDAKEGAVIATDGHCLAVLPVAVENEPESRYLTGRDLAEARLEQPAAAVKAFGPFPDWRKSAEPPWKEGAPGTVTFSLDALILDRLARAIGATGSSFGRKHRHVVLTMRLDPSEIGGVSFDAIRVRSPYDRPAGKPHGFIMPVRHSGPLPAEEPAPDPPAAAMPPARSFTWTLPDGTTRVETSEECPDCHHPHSSTMGGICVGCPCPNVRKE